MNISRYCKIAPINWNSISEINSRVEKLGYEVEEIGIELYWHPNEFSNISSQKAIELIKQNGQPSTFTINIIAKKNDDEISIRFRRDTNIHSQEFLIATIRNVEDEIILDSLMEFLNIEVDLNINDSSAKLCKTAFIAYRFDEIGEMLSLRLTRFLELLSFKVTTGRTYSPQKVSEKVQERISKQSIFFVILTEGNDNTWLNQEPSLAKAQEKPIFLLKDSSYNYNSGIFADQEFIPFSIPNFEKSFIQVLEGLRELKLLE